MKTFGKGHSNSPREIKKKKKKNSHLLSLRQVSLPITTVIIPGIAILLKKWLPPNDRRLPICEGQCLSLTTKVCWESSARSAAAPAAHSWPASIWPAERCLPTVYKWTPTPSRCLILSSTTTWLHQERISVAITAGIKINKQKTKSEILKFQPYLCCCFFITKIITGCLSRAACLERRELTLFPACRLSLHAVS